ncbi:hypothetical protein A0H81_09542 [Grifola frondosa]|uniref:Uncharacterized protein n=1 Tax=Grifola frondosa TaxID=5627 RepID=A0A1C7M1U9_GRIFR|nr:hypothetical protein A0H81_09542 [Grifola frondosa]
MEVLCPLSVLETLMNRIVLSLTSTGWGMLVVLPIVHNRSSSSITSSASPHCPAVTRFRATPVIFTTPPTTRMRSRTAPKFGSLHSLRKFSSSCFAPCSSHLVQ